jgi:hypothetical protein
MNDSTFLVFKSSINYIKPSISIESNWYIVGGFIFIILSIPFLKRRFGNQINNIFVSEMTFEINTPIFKCNTKLQRSYQNLYIANRIYIELVTRKAAILIDENKDVIFEVYDSWYILFKKIREEIKNLPGEVLVHNQNSKLLIELTIQILNEGLRPHLTEYQAEFRKWYSYKIKEDERSPQEIQKDFPKHLELFESMLKVNELLILYSQQLKQFIYTSETK